MRLIRLLKHDLAQEASGWVDDGIIDGQQAQRICHRYGSDYPPPDRASTGYRALLLLGYLFLGLAAITLVGANWDQLPRWLRMAALVLLTLGVQCYATHRWFQAEHKAASALYFLGNLLFGVSIILIAQIYHLGEHMPDGVFWWALGCLPFALLCRSGWLMVQTLFLALIWFYLETRMGYPAFAMPLFLLSAIWVLRVGNKNTLLFLATAFGSGFWLETILAHWWSPTSRSQFQVEHLLVGAALLVFGYAVAQTLQARSAPHKKDYGLLLELWCLRGGLVVLFALSFDEVWQELYRADWEHYAQALMVTCVLLFSAAIMLRQSPMLVATVGSSLTLLAISALIALTPYAINPALLQIVSNVLLVVLGIALIVHGIQRGVSHYFFTGIAVLLLTALLRYVDLIGDYVGAAALFAVFALLMLGAARYWKSHQQKGDAA